MATTRPDEYVLLTPVWPTTPEYTAPALSGTGTTLTGSDSSNWTTDQWAGYVVTLTAGTGSGQTKDVESNDDSTLTLKSGQTFSPEPDDTTVFELRPSKGTATAGASGTLTDTNKAWPTNKWRGFFVTITAGTGEGQRKNIASNTATVLTLVTGETFATPPSTDSVYEIGPTGPMTGYTLAQAAPALVNPVTLAIESPPATYSLLPVSAADPIGEEIAVATFDATHKEHIHLARRSSMVTRWRTEMAGTYVDSSGNSHVYDYDVEWLIRSAPWGLGASLSQAVFIREFSGLPGFTLHNPTHGGSGMRPFFDFDTDGGPLRRIAPSPNLHFALASGPPGTSFVQGATVPLEFEADGGPPYPNPASGQFKGGSNDKFVAFWRHKPFHHIDPHYGGRKFVHRHTYWFYDALAWDGSVFGDPGAFSYSVVAGLGGIDLPFDHAYFVELTSGTLTEIDQPTWAGETDMILQAFKDKLKTFIVPPTVASQKPSPFPTGYGGAILRRESNDFTIGIAFKIGPEEGTPGVVVDQQGPSTLCQIFQNRPGSTTTPPYDNWDSSGILLFKSSAYARTRGWAGLQFFAFQGPFGAVVDSLREVYTSGLLDQQIDGSVMPAHLLVGTEFGPPPTGGGVVVPTSTPLPTIITGTGTGTGGTGSIDDANSYATLVFANTYHATYGAPTTWSGASNTARQDALRIATRYLDLRYGSLWVGFRSTATQALDWPRTGATDQSQYVIDPAIVPVRLQQACAEAAHLHLLGEDLLPTPQESGDIRSESVSIGPISEAITYQGSKPALPVFPSVDRLVRSGGLVGSGSWALR